MATWTNCPIVVPFHLFFLFLQNLTKSLLAAAFLSSFGGSLLYGYNLAVVNSPAEVGAITFTQCPQWYHYDDGQKKRITICDLNVTDTKITKISSRELMKSLCISCSWDRCVPHYMAGIFFSHHVNVFHVWFAAVKWPALAQQHVSIHALSFSLVFSQTLVWVSFLPVLEGYLLAF